MSADCRQCMLLGALIVAAALAVFVAFASAQTWIVANGLAVHFDRRAHCESTTPGLGIEHNNYALGVYRNSNCRWSAYAAKAWMPLRAGPFSAGALGGAVTGYQRGVTPVAALAAAYESSRYGLNLIYVPPYQGAGNVLWIQTKIRW